MNIFHNYALFLHIIHFYTIFILQYPCSCCILTHRNLLNYNTYGGYLKTEIENIRGVNSDFAVSRLLECGLIEEVARLNLPGRPAAYSVTNEFLRSCGIKSIEELPDYDNIKIKDEQMLVSDYEKSDSKEEVEE